MDITNELDQIKYDPLEEEERLLTTTEFVNRVMRRINY